VRKEDINVTVENGVLTLTGERKLEKEEKNRRYHRVERAYGSFSRSFTIPDDSDGSKVNAEFSNGVLKLHLAKSEKAKPRTIEVKVG
jgi:HSP20 family protein